MVRQLIAKMFLPNLEKVRQSFSSHLFEDNLVHVCRVEDNTPIEYCSLQLQMSCCFVPRGIGRLQGRAPASSTQ